MHINVFGRADAFSVVLAIGMCLSSQVLAQVVDSTGVRQDSTSVSAARDSLATIVAVDSVAVDSIAVTSIHVAPSPESYPGFSQYTITDTTSFGRPARRAELNVPSLLGREAGVFHYEFGTLGWPEAISIEGSDPARTELLFDGLPFDDLITGGARYELLPYATVNSIGIRTSGPGIMAGAVATTRSYSEPGPQTDLQYRSGGNGLSFIDAVHVQNRSVKALGVDSRLQLLASYSGSSHTGDYPGSRFESARQLQGRIRFQRPGWSIELYDLYNKQLVGAHAGVISTDGSYDSIYFRLGATVNYPEAKRGIVRNDFRLTFRRFIAKKPSVITLAWSTQNFSYTNPSGVINTDSVDIRVQRFTTFVRQPIGLAKHALTVEFTGWTDQYVSGNEKNKPSDESRYYLGLLLSDSVRVARLEIRASLGAHSDDGVFFPSAIADLRLGAARFSVSYTGVRSNWFDTRGLGNHIQPLEDNPQTRQFRTAVGADYEWGSTRIDITGFYTSVSNQVLWKVHPEAGIYVGTASKSHSRVGAYLDLSFRPTGAAGLYASLRPSVVKLISPADNYESILLDNALPEFWINGRIGVRRFLFKGDMDLDLSVRGMWSSSLGQRVLESRSGLLMVDAVSGRELNAATKIDVVAEVGVKSATIFLSFENILYGNNTGTGISYVPFYPVPAQRFRFGIFWPIEN